MQVRTTGLFAGLALILLAGCLDPLADVERLSEVPLAQDAGAANIGATPAEAAGEGFIRDIVETTDDSAAVDTAPDAVAETSPEQAAAAAAPQGGGFLRGFLRGKNAAPTPTGPDAAVIAPGQMLPYGEIATVCGLSAADLGSPVSRPSASGHLIYDSAPGSAAQRNHYLTGFADGCARQFTAALAMFGDVGTHEMVRYLPDNANRPYSATDTAYEQIKAQVCGVAAGQPCGDRLDRLAREAVFISVYETFGTNPRWANILIHDGAVVAMDFHEG